MFRNILFCGAWLLSYTAIAVAQNTTQFCPAGVHPDGFLDWSKLPPPPSSSGPGPGQPFTTTIPVAGVPGLTVTITFNGAVGTLYSTTGNTLLTVRNPNSGSLSMTFSQPIQGMRLDALTFGRFGHTFDMQVKTLTGTFGGPGSVPQTFDSSSAGSDITPGRLIRTPLQIGQVNFSNGSETEETPQIQAVTFTFQGEDSEYQSFSLDNVRIQTGPRDLSGLAPTNGLLQWLRADKGFTSFFGSPTVWADQSGNGNSASQSDPSYVPTWEAQNGPNCLPAVNFSGSAFLQFTLPIDGLNGMTAFLVARANNDTSDGTYHSQHAALFWVENASWGNTYVSPFQTHAAYRFGTTQTGNDPEILRPANLGGDFTLTTAIHNGSTDSLYVNGKLFDNETGRQSGLAGMTGEGFIGQGFQNTFFTGDISEILIYNRALSAEERERVESYLMMKYGLQ